MDASSSTFPPPPLSGKVISYLIRLVKKYRESFYIPWSVACCMTWYGNTIIQLHVSGCNLWANSVSPWFLRSIAVPMQLRLRTKKKQVPKNKVQQLERCLNRDRSMLYKVASPVYDFAVYCSSCVISVQSYLWLGFRH